MVFRTVTPSVVNLPSCERPGLPGPADKVRVHLHSMLDSYVGCQFPALIPGLDRGGHDCYALLRQWQHGE